MAGNTTRAEANRSFFVYVTEPNTGVVKRVAIPADLQVGLEGRPAELQLFGRLSLASQAINVDATNKGLINVSNDDTVVALSLVVTPLSGRISAHLPPTPREGQLHFIKDASGTAATVPIDIVPDVGVTIDDVSTKTLSDNYSSMALVWLAGQWHMLVAGLGASGGGGGSTGSSGGGASVSASYVTVTSEPGLTGARVIAVGTGINKVDGGAGGNLTLSVNDGVVATLTGSRFSGPIRAAGGLSGSLQQLDGGLSYLVAGPEVSVVSQSSGQVIVSSRDRFSLEFSTSVSSTDQNATNVKKVGARSYDASFWPRLSATSTVVFHTLLETTNATNPASSSLFRYSGAGAPLVLVSLVTSSTVMTELTTDVSTFFRPGQASGIFAVTVNLTTGSTTDYATTSGAWLEFTP